jgi:RND family efflux transporter MFP subunit
MTGHMAKIGSAVWLVGGALVLAAVVWRLRAEDPAPEQGGGRPPFVLSVTLAPLERGNLEPRASLTGVVRSNQHARMGFELPGRIVELAVDQGDEVAQGALLARLDDRDAQAGLLRAKSQLELAQRELEATLAGERDEDKRRLAAELEAREAEAELARRDVERGRGLVADSIISQGEFDIFEAAYNAAQARARAAKEELAAAQAGARVEEIAVARAAVELRRSEHAVAERELEKTRLVAPFAGVIVRRSAALGDSITLGQQVLELVDFAHRELEIDVPGHVAAKLADRAKARVTLDERPGVELDLEVHSLIPLADDSSRHFRAIARLAEGQDPERAFVPGMFARVDLETRPLREVWIAPADAVRITPQGPLVVLARPGGAPDMGGAPTFTAELVPVRELANSAGRSALEPLSGAFAAGDQVVVIGVDMAFPGAALAPRNSAPPAGASQP